MNEFINSIDLGTSKICVTVSQLDKSGKPQILGVGKSKCNGIRKGVVVDIESTTRAILEAIEQAQNMSDTEIEEAYINLPGGYSNITSNRGVIAVTGENREITVEDVKRVLNSATIISISENQQIIDVIPNQYIIDGYDEIRDPIGMVGIRLEVDADIITGSVTTVNNLIKSVNKAGIDVLGIVIEPLALSQSVLSKDEKELGVLLIDMGAGTCDVSVFKNSRIIYSKLIPVGGNHITNDISVGLRISYDESEEIKKKHGITYIPMSSKDNVFEINPIGSQEQVNINEMDLTEIIEARVGELLEIINNDLLNHGIKNEILTDIVITGGALSYLKGIEELSQQIFDLSVRIGQPHNIGMKEPIYSTTVGLVNYISKRDFNYIIDLNNVDANRKINKKNSTNMISAVKKFFREYF